MSEKVSRYYGAIDGQSKYGNWVHISDYLALEKRLAEADKLYIELTNSECITDDGEFAGYHVSSDLMRRFDELFQQGEGDA